MKKNKNFLKFAVLLGCGLVVVAGLYLYFSLNSLVKVAIETVGSRLTGTTVQVSSVRLMPFVGRGTINGFTIKNPQGFQSEYAVRVGRIHLALDVKSLVKKTIHIYKIEVDEPAVNYEVSSRGSNLARIQEHVDGFSSGSSESESRKSEKKVLIDDFRLTGAKAQLAGVPVVGGAGLSLPEIHLTNIGRDSSGVPMKDAAEKIMGTLTKTIAQNVGQQPGKILTDTVKSLNPADVAQKLKGLFH